MNTTVATPPIHSLRHYLLAIDINGSTKDLGLLRTLQHHYFSQLLLISLAMSTHLPLKKPTFYDVYAGGSQTGEQKLVRVSLSEVRLEYSLLSMNPRSGESNIE